MGDSVSAVAIAPDGRHALASKCSVNKVAWLDIDGQKVTYSKLDFGVGVFPFNVQITADGRFGLTANPGNVGVPDGGAGSDRHRPEGNPAARGRLPGRRPLPGGSCDQSDWGPRRRIGAERQRRQPSGIAEDSSQDPRQP